jgi:Ca2+-transporting ATPase
MGICGTDVAKKASKIVILDDNFNSIVKSVKWGRSVYDNIRKFLQFQLTVNVVALLVAFWGAVFRFGTPLTAVQLLWVNLIMDTLAALAFSTEKPTDELLNRRPYGRSGQLISGVMWRNIISQSIYQFAILMVLLFAVDAHGNHYIISGAQDGRLFHGHANVHFTIIFNVFVFCQIFNEFNSRKCDRKQNVFESLFTNYMFIIIIIVTIIFQILCVQLFGLFTKTVPLTFNQWMLSVAFGFLCIPYAAIIRLTVTPCIPIDPMEVPANEDNPFLPENQEVIVK